MTAPTRRAPGVRRGLLAAATVVLLLALGPFASPLVGQDDGGFAGETPIDHRNEIPVVQPGRSSAAPTSARLPSSRSLLVVALVAELLLVAAEVRRTRPTHTLEPDPPPSWSLPPHRGPPLLAAG